MVPVFYVPDYDGIYSFLEKKSFIKDMYMQSSLKLTKKDDVARHHEAANVLKV